MAAGDKKKIKAELKAYPLKEMGKEAREFITNSKDLTKKFAPIIWSKDVMLDPRKWTKKSLADGMLAVARYEMKLLAVRAAKIAKDAAAGGDPKKHEKALSKEYDEVKKQIIDKVSLAVEEVEEDKGDNKKSLKDCKGAFDKLDKVDFDGMYSGPRSLMVDVFSWLEDNLEGAEKKEEEKLFAEAGKQPRKTRGLTQNSGRSLRWS